MTCLARHDYGQYGWPTRRRSHMHMTCILDVRIMPPAVNKFTNVSQIENFVRMHVHVVNRCSDYRHHSYSCHLKNYNSHEARAFAKPSVDGCKFEHFHHLPV